MVGPAAVQLLTVASPKDENKGIPRDHCKVMTKRNRRRSLTKVAAWLFASSALVALGGCNRNEAAIPNSPNRIAAAEGETGNWLTHGRTYSEQRFSPLDRINVDTVKNLGLAWYADFDTGRGQETTPLVIDGVILATSSWSKVYALDAASGRTLWKYDPKVPGDTAVKACCDVVNRGVAYWQGRLFVGTLDARLIALDAKTGKVIWSTVTVDQSQPYTITGAPRVVRGNVIIGNGGAEYGVRGYVSAYDTATGKLAWRFYTVPGDPSKPFEHPDLKAAAATWTGEWWKLGGGGTVWDSMAYDAELDLLYIGVGNGSPWNQQLRSPGGGDNLYISSIVALRGQTGEYVWHYQTTPGEMWDYTATQHIVLADLVIDGATRKVLMQAPKNGFFYVLDRTDGKLLSAKPYAPINWASGVDPKTGRPIVNPDAYYATTGKPWLAMPGPLGAHSWHPMSFNPPTGLMYIPSFELGFPYIADQQFEPRQLAVNLGIDLDAASLPQDAQVKAQVMKAVRGHLIAWDPVAQEKVWDVEHPAAWNGGVLSTAGNLVFQGTAAGEFIAYDARTGRKAWSFPAQEGIVAPPVSYQVGGEQYVLVAAGWGGVFALFAGEIARQGSVSGKKGRLLAFKLGGKQTLPAADIQQMQPVKLPERFGDAAIVARGKATFQRFCAGCHGDSAVSGGVLPDLRRSGATGDKAAWHAIVRDGALRARGMVSFATELTVDDAEAIRAYVAQRASEDSTLVSAAK